MFALCMSRGAAASNAHPNTATAAPAIGTQQTRSRLAKQVKGGYLLRYKRGWLWRSWSEEWVVLYEDSTVAWFKDKGAGRPRGRIVVSEAPEMLAVGDWTRQIPRRPKLPENCNAGQLLAFGSRGKAQVTWLMAQSAAEVNDWMTAISNTLPPPPHVVIDKDKRCSVTLIRDASNYANSNDATASNGRGYEEDHTVPPGVVIDWGRGWGWGEAAWAAQMACAHDSAVNTALYCASDDYVTGGYEDVDCSACGDFSF